MSDYKIFCTNTISSFNVTKNKLVMTLVYIPYQKAFKDTWWGGTKTVIINPCWIEEKEARFTALDIYSPKKLEYLNNAIKEEEVVYDMKNVGKRYKDIAMDSMDRYGYSIENSDFHKWFKHNFNNHYYYTTITQALGNVTKIEIYQKGNIEINVSENCNECLRLSKFIPNDFVAGKLLKEIGQSIVDYPFFLITKDEDIEFLKLNKNNDAKLIICQ